MDLGKERRKSVKMTYNHEELLHCLDYEAYCPAQCIRAKVTKDYRMHEDNYAGITTHWTNGGSSFMCKKQNGCPCKECTKESCINPLVCDDYIAGVCKG